MYESSAAFPSLLEKESPSLPLIKQCSELQQDKGPACTRACQNGTGLVQQLSPTSIKWVSDRKRTTTRHDRETSCRWTARDDNAIVICQFFLAQPSSAAPRQQWGSPDLDRLDDGLRELLAASSGIEMDTTLPTLARTPGTAVTQASGVLPEGQSSAFRCFCWGAHDSSTLHIDGAHEVDRERRCQDYHWAYFPGRCGLHAAAIGQKIIPTARSKREAGLASHWSTTQQSIDGWWAKKTWEGSIFLSGGLLRASVTLKLTGFHESSWAKREKAPCCRLNAAARTEEERETPSKTSDDYHPEEQLRLCQEKRSLILAQRYASALLT
ncbi:hypothetical protein QBC36DRAFT_316402 [Triangularia setosa]|uniref:Uncharacterized protein n=1 Tax=Triangularia setosa TaxID=2587417 RepID=A0AAN6VXW1_9PEZI|nr:hypothetical protein QBC36DRAFT_316402 [Podospora setosa]